MEDMNNKEKMMADMVTKYISLGDKLMEMMERQAIAVESIAAELNTMNVMIAKQQNK